MPITLDDIALRKSERGLITGGVGSGKSTLMERLIGNFGDRYPNGRILILDTKPRFRAEYEVSGLKAKKRYANWDHGAYIPQSVAGDLNQKDCGLDAAWRMNANTVILQTDHPKEWPQVLHGAAVFFVQARASRPQLLAIDEMMDFFGGNGQPIAGMGEDRDTILRAARAGRERGLGVLASMQRPKSVPITVIQELTRLYLFRLDNTHDVDTLYDYGIPESVTPPTRDHVFCYWRRGDQKPRLLQLNLKE